MNKLKIHQIPLTPILGVLLPIAYLANANISQINLDDITRSILVTCAAAIGLLLLGWAIYRNIYKSAVLVTFALLLFFSYGHLYHVIHGARWFLGRHRILIPLICVLVLAAAVLVFRTRRDLRALVGYSNIILFVLILYSAVPAGVEFYKYSHARVVRREKLLEMEAAEGVGAVKPDIYYIVLDWYGRSDALKEKFNYDNSAFNTSLSDLGFYVVECSQSNYQSTMLSLVSTLNSRYWTDTPSTQPGEETFSTDIKLQREDMLNNNARMILEDQGYTTVAFQTGYGFSEWTDADIYYSLDNASGMLNDFETLLSNTTMVLAISDYQSKQPVEEKEIDWETYDESPEYRYQIKLNTLKNLGTISDVPGPKFVFAHVLLPHGPFVFDADGNWTGGHLSEEEGYIPQLEYTNKRIIPILKNIIENSDIPPIIMLASDHGVDEPNPDLRLKNIMAYYVPDEMRVKLYPTMTPVNSFRIVLDTLGYQDLPLLDDYSFFSAGYQVDPFHLIPASCPNQ